MKLEEAIAKAKILNDSLKELTDEYEGQGSFIAAGMAVSFKLVLDTILTALHPVSREQLLREAWGYQSMGETRTVDVHVQRLRKKLGEDWIETVYKCGYRLRLA